jgi:hypothetical protein
MEERGLASNFIMEFLRNNKNYNKQKRILLGGIYVSLDLNPSKSIFAKSLSIVNDHGLFIEFKRLLTILWEENGDKFKNRLE